MALQSTYSPKNFVAAFGEVNLSGFGPDAFIDIVYNSDAVTLQMGGDGVTNTRSMSADNSARITFTAQQHAPVNDLLSLLLRGDRTLGAGVRPLGIRDLTTGMTFVAKDAWIVKPPDANFAAQAGVTVWLFETDDLVSSYGDPLSRSV